MKNASVSDLKNNLSKYLRFVKQGEVVVVCDRGVPVAEIQPRKGKAQGTEDRLQALVSKGIIRKNFHKKLKPFAFPKGEVASGVLEELLEERQSGR